MAGGNQRARLAVKTSTRSDPFNADFWKSRNDRWGTPLEIVRACGTFDLDPCGMPGHPTASTVWTPEEIGDGLSHTWEGRVWLNPPYGRTMRAWVERLVVHDGGGIALIPVATGTKLWQDVVFEHATAIHWWRHRINFLRDDRPDSIVSPTETALVAFTEADARALIRSGLPGHTTRYTNGGPGDWRPSDEN